MLRRRGIEAIMLAGVKILEDASLAAHAWIDAGDEVNDENQKNSEYTVVVRIGHRPARFPRSSA